MMDDKKQQVEKWNGCKHLDYSDSFVETCKLKNAFGDNYYWHREDMGDNVQFCGHGRGRIPGIFQCINQGEMHCFEKQEGKEVGFADSVLKR